MANRRLFLFTAIVALAAFALLVAAADFSDCGAGHVCGGALCRHPGCFGRAGLSGLGAVLSGGFAPALTIGLFVLLAARPRRGHSPLALIKLNC